MAKFKFYQDKEVTTCVRDYYEVEANTLEDAIEYVKNMGCSFDEDELKSGSKVEFIKRDWDWNSDFLVDFADSRFPIRYTIVSCDLEGGDDEYDCEVVNV